MKIIPFGKYKGSSVEEISQRDPNYLDWIQQQQFVVEKFADLHRSIIAISQPENEDSPEHNAMQNRFLDTQFQERFHCLLTYGTPDKHLAHQRVIDLSETGGCILTRPINRRISVRFEMYGWDVELTCIDYSDLHEFGSLQRRFEVEIKPLIGEDYPSVLRQMKRRKCCFEGVLLIGEFVGQVTSYEQFKAVFEQEGIRVVRLADVLA